METFLVRTSQGFEPADDDEAVKCKKFGHGEIVRCTIVIPRNVRFFRKWWALVKVAFDAWCETDHRQEYKGQIVEPDFDRFRKDVTILSGFYRPVFNVKGEIRMEPESLNFASMTEERFEELFSATINTILQKILPRGRFSERQLRDLVEQVLNFDH